MKQDDKQHSTQKTLSVDEKQKIEQDEADKRFAEVFKRLWGTVDPDFDFGLDR